MSVVRYTSGRVISVPLLDVFWEATVDCLVNERTDAFVHVKGDTMATSGFSTPMRLIFGNLSVVDKRQLRHVLRQMVSPSRQRSMFLYNEAGVA